MINTDNQELNIEADNVTTNIDIDNNNAEIDINKIDVELESMAENLEIDSDVLRIVEKDHKKLENLDYEKSGHTGFASAKDIEDINNDLNNYVSYSTQSKTTSQQNQARKNIGIPNACVLYNQNQNLNEINKLTARNNIGAKKNTRDLGEIDLSGYNDTDTYSWNDWISFLTSSQGLSLFALKNHVHYSNVTIAYTIRTYLDGFTGNGDYRITSNADKELYILNCYYYNVSVNGVTQYRRLQRYYSISEPWKIYSRFGLYNTSTKKITWNAWHVIEGVEE